MIQDAENDRKYNMQVQKAQFAQQQRTAQQGLLQDKLNNNKSLVYANQSLQYKDGVIQIPTDKVLARIKDGYLKTY